MTKRDKALAEIFGPEEPVNRMTKLTVESSLHYKAKVHLHHRLIRGMFMTRTCPDCGEEYLFSCQPTPPDRVVLEGSFRVGHEKRNVRPDVAVIREDGSLALAVEIVVTHAMTTTKKFSLADGHVHWIEVQADLIDPDYDTPLKVVGTSLPKGQCGPCADRRRALQRAQQEHERQQQEHKREQERLQLEFLNRALDELDRTADPTCLPNLDDLFSPKPEPENANPVWQMDPPAPKPPLHPRDIARYMLLPNRGHNGSVYVDPRACARPRG